MSTMMHDKVQKMTFTLLTACMLLMCQCVAALASSVDSVQVRSAPLVSDTITRDGMVRVYLSSLGNPTSLDLTINGNYSLSHSGEFIANGSKLHVGFSPANGSITLTYNGQTMNMGKSFSLRRHSSGGANGILIAQSRDSQNPYPGDLSFEAVSNGSGYTLYTVAHIYIENYLYGVLPYEMGNSSGIEALKAQAVAARTYTVRMMEKRASGRYDVKDTTSDQVYRGTPSGNTNCVAAVDATKGIVLMYGSDYITTYYSASNGGQTETARTGTSYAYMKIKDDPFDYANPSSTVKKKTLYADLTSTSNPAALISLLESKVISTLQQSGYPATDGNTSLQSLRSVTPHTPMYASPSRVYTKMDFTFSVSTVNASGQKTTVVMTETCDIFTQLESILGMSIQSLKNELWSVEKGNGTFVLQARRYGHGMGMSQRGAMYMAKLGYTYDQILGFYYDGCKRVRHSFTNSILSASSSDQQITVEPPADLEENDTNACTGTVLLSGNGATLAIRASASSDATVIGTAGNGAMVDVLIREGDWYQIRFGEIIGFVQTSALSVQGTPSGERQNVSSTLGFAMVKANDFVNLRASGSMNAKVLGTAPAGAVLTVFSQSGSWAKVQYNALAAYVNTNYISSITSAYPSAGLTNGTQKAVVVTTDGTGTVNLRQSASTNAKLVNRLKTGTIVTVLSDDGSWCWITSEEGDGYILSEFLKYTDDTQEEADEPEEDTENDSEDAGQQTAVVATENGSLNMRAQAKAGSRILTTIPKGAQVIVLAKGDVWTAVRYSGYDGYVMSSYLSFAADEPAQSPPENDVENDLKAMVVTPSGTLNLRVLPQSGSRIQARIPPNTILTVLQRQTDWSMVEYQNMTGYVMNAFLSFEYTENVIPPSDPEEDAGQPETPNALTAYVKTQSGSLNLRRQPSLNSGVLAGIPQYAAVTVSAYGDEWCAVRYGAYEGYVMTAFLSFEQQKPQQPETEIPDQSEDQSKQEPTPAWVVTSGGSLNLRSASSGNAGILTTIPRYAQVAVIEEGTEWSRVSYGGYEGYVMSRFLNSEKPAETQKNSEEESLPDRTEDDTNEETTETYVTVGGIILDVTLTAPDSTMYAAADGDTNVYGMCSDQEPVLMTVPEGEEVEILLVGDLWCRIAYQDEQGYCERSNLNVR